MAAMYETNLCTQSKLKHGKVNFVPLQHRLYSTVSVKSQKISDISWSQIAQCFVRLVISTFM